MKRSVLFIAGIVALLFLFWIGRSSLLKSPTPDTFERTITIPPHRRIIKEITPELITITDTEGDALLSNDPKILSVFLRKNEQLVTYPLKDLTVGQQVTVVVVKPGKEIRLILETL